MKKGISLKNLSKKYPNGILALNNVSLDLHYGELVGLIGPNGAGKSTLIHTIAGILQPSSGTIACFIDDPKDLAWVSQKSSIDWYLPVIDNVKLGARLGGCSIQEAKSIAKENVIKVGLEKESTQLPDSLSGGQQRRLQIARALAQNAKILILDEPTTGLDPFASKQFLSEIRNIANQGKLVLISSHDLHSLEGVVDRIVFLSEGTVKLDQEISNLLNSTSWISIEYEGEISSTVRNFLEQYRWEILTEKSIKITIENPQVLPRIFTFLIPQIDVTDIKLSRNNLHELYLSMNERK